MRFALFCLLLQVAHAGDFDPPLPDPTVRLRTETVLDATRWQGLRVTPEERIDVRQRLGMDGFLRREGPRLNVHLDLEVGSDFGPEPDAWRAQPNGRRVVVDVYAARLDLHTEPLDLSLGRQILYDVLGVDALDGLSARLRPAPFLTLEAAGGLATRRGWSSFGPDVFEPDGTALSDEPGFVLRTRVGTRGLSWLAASAGWTRQLDGEVQSETTAAEARIGAKIFNVNGRLHYALTVREMEDLALGLSSARSHYQVQAGWRRHRPIFSADSIWNAFRREPWDAWEAAGNLRVGAFDLAADTSLRLYDSGPGEAQAPALTAHVDPPAETDPTAFEGGASISRALPTDRPGARIGAEIRHASGYGGLRHYGDIFARVPWLYRLGREPVWLRARAGGVRFSEVDDTREGGLSGWALLAAEWAPEETIRLEALSELYAGGPDPTRLRVMLRMTLEDGW